MELRLIFHTLPFRRRAADIITPLLLRRDIDYCYAYLRYADVFIAYALILFFIITPPFFAAA